MKFYYSERIYTAAATQTKTLERIRTCVNVHFVRIDKEIEAHNITITLKGLDFYRMVKVFEKFIGIRPKQAPAIGYRYGCVSSPGRLTEIPLESSRSLILAPCPCRAESLHRTRLALHPLHPCQESLVEG